VAGSSVLLDTNLLVLFVVGMTDRELVSRHKRTSSYVKQDYILLKHELATTLSSDGELVSTPSILAETSNLLGHRKPDKRKKDLQSTLSRLILTDMREEHVESTLAVKQRGFSRLGLTDSGILELASTGHLVLTDDLPLYREAVALGLQCENFTHRRQGITL